MWQGWAGLGWAEGCKKKALERRMNVTANTKRHVHFMAAKRWTLLPQSPCRGRVVGKGEGGVGGRRGRCMATATSHEATKSNCVATDCALGGAKQRGQRGSPSACSDQWHGGRVGWRRGQGRGQALPVTARRQLSLGQLYELQEKRTKQKRVK